jgi:hypothetical protein
MTDTNIRIVSRDRSQPSPLGQGEYGPMRSTRYGEPIVAARNPRTGADDGSYFVATNPTMGTGIAGIAASTSYDAAEHLLFLRNLSDTKRLELDFIDLVVTAAGAAGTTTGFTMVGDRGTSRRGTGGSSITPVCPNLAMSETADVTLAFGALATGSASADVRPLGDFLVRTVIKVVGDSYRFVFGDPNAVWSLAGASLDGTTSAKVTIPCPGVVLGETDQFLLSDWAASQSGASSYQLRMGFWLR